MAAFVRVLPRLGAIDLPRRPVLALLPG